MTGERVDTAPRVAWIVREYPYASSGHAAWLRSLLASCRSSGFDNRVLLPGGRGLPFVLPRGDETLSPHLRSYRDRTALSGWALGKAAALGAYRCLPTGVQVTVAGRRRARRRRVGYDHVLGTPFSSSEQGWLREELDRLRPDIVVFDSVFSLVPTSSAARVLLVPDLLTERVRSLASKGYRVRPDGIHAEWEAQQIRQVDGIVTIQWDDADRVRRWSDAPVVTAPPTFEWRPPDPGGTGCLVVGSGALPNVDGLRWLLADVWPLVHAARPDASLSVVGSVGTQVRAPSGVRILGEVRDIDAHYRSSAVVLVPLRVGSGLKVKLAEAICHGRATVTTSVGAQGLGKLAPAPYVAEDDPQRFAQAVVALLADPAARSRLEAAAAAASRAFDPADAHRPLTDLLVSLARPSRHLEPGSPIMPVLEHEQASPAQR